MAMPPVPDSLALTITRDTIAITFIGLTIFFLLFTAVLFRVSYARPSNRDRFDAATRQNLVEELQVTILVVIGTAE